MDNSLPVDALPDGLLLADINRFKKTYGPRLVLIETEVDGGPTCFFLFRPADRTVYEMAAKVGGTNHIKSLSVVMENTLLWASAPKALDDMRIFLAVAKHVETFNAPAQTRLKNL